MATNTRPVLDSAFVSHLHHQRVQIDDYVQRLQRTALPGAHLVHHFFGDLADQRRTNVHAVHLAQMSLDVARAHAARVHRNDLVVEARPAALVLGQNLRLEAPVAIARHPDLHRAEITLHSFPAVPVAVVAAAAPFRLPFFVSEMMRQLGIHGPLQQRFR
jgi:hypothetical protein